MNSLVIDTTEIVLVSYPVNSTSSTAPETAEVCVLIHVVVNVDGLKQPAHIH